MSVIFAVAAVAVLAVAAGAYLLFVHHPGGTGMWARFLTWLRSLLERIFRRGDDAPPPRFPAVQSRPAPARPAAPAGGGPVLAAAPLDVSPGEIPPAAIPFLAWVHGLDPETDEDVMAFGRGMGAFHLALGEAVDTALQTCLAPGLRLDPMSVAGLGDYADEVAESAHTAVAIWHRFLVVYEEVKQFVASGGQLPKDGDFLTGEG